MEKRTGVKVLKKYGRYYCSISCAVRRIYRVGEIVTRRKGCGPLALFDSIYWAEKFIQRAGIAQDKCLVVECEYLPSEESVLYYPAKLESARIIKLQLYPHVGLMTKKFLPEGTVTADWLRFTEYPKPINLI